MQLRQALRLGEREVVSFAGGGGKTTAMFRLAAEIVAAGGQVVTTTTTRIFAAQTALAPAHLVADESGRLPPDFEAQLAAHGHVLVTGPIDVAEGKATGVPPGLLARLAARPDLRAVIVEADGSRMRPLKAPAEHEPVIPPATTILVAVAGADVLGRPLDGAWVHRVERASRLTGLPLGQRVTPAAVARLLTHPDGGQKRRPAGARAVALLNKVELLQDFEQARSVARLALGIGAVDSVLLGSVASSEAVAEAWSRTAAVVLAAGGATRMGDLKQVFSWGNTTLVGHAADAALASEADETLVVVGHEAERVIAALEGRPVRVVHNPFWAQGQSTSVRAGLRALPAGCAAAIFLVADQPFVSGDVLTALLQRHRETLAPIVAPRVRGRRVNPTLFDRSTWPDLDALTGDSGGRALFASYAGQTAWVDWEVEIGLDVDTPEDYRALSAPAQR